MTYNQGSGIIIQHPIENGSHSWCEYPHAHVVSQGKTNAWLILTIFSRPEPTIRRISSNRFSCRWILGFALLGVSLISDEADKYIKIETNHRLPVNDSPSHLLSWVSTWGYALIPFVFCL